MIAWEFIPKQNGQHIANEENKNLRVSNVEEIGKAENGFLPGRRRGKNKN